MKRQVNGIKSIGLFENTRSQAAEKMREAAVSVLPIVLIVLLLCLFVAPMSPALLLSFLLGAVLIAGYVLLMASFGLFVGLKMPNLHWTNEIKPIKQGGAVMLALFSGFAYAALIVVGYLLLGSKIGLTAYLAAFAALTLLLAALLLRWLHKTGCRIFASL